MGGKDFLANCLGLGGGTGGCHRQNEECDQGDPHFWSDVWRFLKQSQILVVRESRMKWQYKHLYNKYRYCLAFYCTVFLYVAYFLFSFVSSNLAQC